LLIPELSVNHVVLVSQAKVKRVDIPLCSHEPSGMLYDLHFALPEGINSPAEQNLSALTIGAGESLLLTAFAKNTGVSILAIVTFP
jgi:hypothetical protein